jgi:hypothetical protein
MELERPETIHIHDQLQPRGPWSFAGEAVPGGLGSWGIQLILAWITFEALTSATWAAHIQKLAGHSSLPNYWGELLTVRDIWELVENGGLKNHPTGFWAPLLGTLAILWILWAGWQLQARAVNQTARLKSWAWGALDALLIGLVPFSLLSFGLAWVLEGLASSGIPGLGWLNLVGNPLIKFSCLSALSLQWWLCRIDRTAHPMSWNMRSLEVLGRHLGRSFLRLWLHPVQWFTLILGGVVARLGLHFLVFLLAWYLGGGTPTRVWIFLLLELLATALNAWLLGWFLRVSALFWRQDFRIRQEVEALKRLVDGE